MYKRRFSRFPRRKILRRRRGLGKKRSVSKSVKRYVKRAIHRNIENKEIYDFFNNTTIKTLGPSNNGGTNVRQLLPLPAQGTDDHQRIGNQIRVVKGFIRGSVNLKAYNSTTNPLSTPCLVKMWLFRDLAVSATQPLQNGTYTTYFDDFFKGNGLNYGFQGNPLDMYFNINTDKYRLLASKQFKVGAASVSTTTGSAGYYDNSPMSVPFYFNWGKFCKKQLKWNDSGSYPTNENIYLVVTAVRADGTASTDLEMCEWHAVNTIKYEDA